jgi:hypothetical protein
MENDVKGSTGKPEVACKMNGNVFRILTQMIKDELSCA